MMAMKSVEPRACKVASPPLVLSSNASKQNRRNRHNNSKGGKKNYFSTTDRPCLLRPGLLRSHVMITPFVAAEATTFSTK